MNPPFFFRYRSIDRLFGDSDELEKQQIYFAKPDELNDPMEGFKDVFWKGDTTLWKNLIRHYLLCLSMVMDAKFIMGNEFNPDGISSMLRWTTSHLPTPILKERQERICSLFLSENSVAECIELLSENEPKIHREELSFYLSILHGLALHITMKVFSDYDLIQPQAIFPSPKILDKKNFSTLRTALQHLRALEPHKRNVSSTIFNVNNRMHQQLRLLRRLNDSSALDHGWIFLTFGFTDFYCNNISDILYPEWYTSCFVSDPTHAAMWGQYGKGHKGVCLKFRPDFEEDGTPMIKMNGLIGFSGNSDGINKIYGERRLSFQRVTYSRKFPEIDFFRSLGKFPIPVTNADWYSDAGKLCQTAYEVYADEDSWRKRYWKSFTDITSTKFEDWQYENEYRLVINPLLDDSISPVDRLLCYNFASLEGIIFGINTTFEDKIRIMKVIEQKCAQNSRKDFEFSQAEYSGSTSKFDIHSLNLLKIS